MEKNRSDDTNDDDDQGGRNDDAADDNICFSIPFLPTYQVTLFE